MIKNAACAMIALLPMFFVVPDGTTSVWERSWALETKNPITKRVAFVVDTSGSMRGEPLAVAHDEALRIMSFATDGTEVRVFAFGDDVIEHSGSWIRLPDEEAVERVATWFGVRGSGGNTDLAGAVVEALRIDDPDLTVVVITDGEPTGPSGKSVAETHAIHLDAIDEAQRRRCRPAVIHVIGVRDLVGTDAHRASLDFMRELAARNRGGVLLWAKRPRKVAEAH